MTSLARICLLLALAAATAFGAAAQQRKVTPVEPVTSRPVATPKEKKPKKEKEKKPTHSERPPSVVEMTDDKGNVFFLDTISGTEWVDSIALEQAKKVGNVYPLLDALSLGLDLWPALGRALGEKQGLGAIWARLSLHNRFFPTLEFGLSSAHKTPRGMNYTYTQPIAPYFKVGLDYNFFYKDNFDYQIFLMARYGLSLFTYQLSDVSLNNSYWGDTERPAFPSQKTLTGYLEVGVGIQVKLWGHISAGWNIKYKRILHSSAETYGPPWAVPGFGTREGMLGVSLSLIYNIPLHDPIILPDKDDNKEPPANTE